MASKDWGAELCTNAVLIDCGGHDICDIHCWWLLHQMRLTFAIIIELIPGVPIIWSCILPKIAWNFSQCIAKTEHTRKGINSEISSFLLKHNRYVVKHPDFDNKLSGLFANDGVHLSFIGFDLFINTYILQDELDTSITIHSVMFTPYSEKIMIDVQFVMLFCCQILA